MLEIFTYLADVLVYNLAGLDPSLKIADALHFFIEDTTKIFALLLLMIYLIALVRASLRVEQIRQWLGGRNRGAGYLLGSFSGAVTPFCSCSSIPLFLGFTSAGIPIGITMSFLLTSPLINEVAVVLLGTLLGWKFTLLYIIVGMAVGILGGAVLDLIRAERLLQPFAAKAYLRADQAGVTAEPLRLTLFERHQFALGELRDIFTRVWKWVIIGVGLGAALHGFVPEGWFEQHLGQGQWWSVPAAVVLGIPLYSNATGVIPVMESLITKGLPIGTTLAFCMSTVAASFPEFILLKQVMQWRLLAVLFALLLAAFTLVGWTFNLLAPFIL
ncbi:permease [Marinobacterium rhizophilum]|uniref:permease n=1 Tax=Marinobacterium rhizophilum TaxID=420402 RepID=UPI000364D76A|nr:permease [Marinobacterium rhizophilum]